MVVECSIETDDRTINFNALIDSGASATAFIDSDFAQQHQFLFHPLSQPRSLDVIDGRPIEPGAITHTVQE